MYILAYESNGKGSCIHELKGIFETPYNAEERVIEDLSDDKYLEDWVLYGPEFKEIYNMLTGNEGGMQPKSGRYVRVVPFWQHPAIKELVGIYYIWEF